MELRAKVFELERQRERKDEQLSQASTGNASRKRKRVVAEPRGSSNGRVLKQARKIVSSSSPEAEDLWLPLSADDREILARDTQSKSHLEMQRKPDANISATTLLQNIYTLQRIRSYQELPVQELATILCQISININSMISTITQCAVQSTPSKLNIGNSTTRAQERPVTKTQIAMDSNFEFKILATYRIFRWVLKSIDPLEHMPAGKALQGQVVYQYVTLLRDFLARICDLAVFHYKDKSSKDKRNRNNNRPQAKAQGPEASRAKAVNDMIIIKLCRLLVTMVLRLDPSKRIQQNILDGFHFFLLTRVGQLLSFFVFHDGPIPMTATQAAKTNAADLRLATPQESTTNIPEQDKSVLQSQAPYLIYILTRLTHFVADTPPPLIVENAREKLQNTVLKSVFGEQAREFVDVLTKPTNPDIDLKEDLIAEGIDEDIGDWYKNEIWKLVGWDILLKHIQWPEEINEPCG